MFKTIKNKIGSMAALSLLKSYETDELDAGKRIVSVIAGVYMLQRGIRCIRKHPLLGVQETLLGGVLLYNGAIGINKKITRRPKELSDVRRNQIQGNDPDSAVPAFV